MQEPDVLPGKKTGHKSENDDAPPSPTSDQHSDKDDGPPRKKHGHHSGNEVNLTNVSNAHILNGGNQEPQAFRMHQENSDAQARASETSMSDVTGILQKDGSICENSDVQGVEGKGELSQEVMSLCTHGNIPKVSQG